MTAPIKGRDVTSELPAGHARLLEKAKRCAPLTTAVVHPVDDLSLEGVVAAAAEGLIEPLLVGPEARIRRAADEAGLDISGFEIVGCPHSEAAAARGVALAREGRVESLMKGALHTDELMKAVLDADLGPHAVGAVRDHIQWRSPARRPTQFRRFGWPTAPYLNSGVMLMDLPACRAMDLLPRAVDLGRREKARLVGHDQTLINCLLRGAFAELSPVWNWQYSKYGRLAEAMVDAHIVHFIGAMKPWRDPDGQLPPRYARALNRFLAEAYPDRDPVAVPRGIARDPGLFAKVALRHAINAPRMARYLARFPDDVTPASGAPGAGRQVAAG